MMDEQAKKDDWFVSKLDQEKKDSLQKAQLIAQNSDAILASESDKEVFFRTICSKNKPTQTLKEAFRRFK
jgi:hypothetical protein